MIAYKGILEKMRQLSQKEKEKILLRLYWDVAVHPEYLFSLLNEETDILESEKEIN